MKCARRRREEKKEVEGREAESCTNGGKCCGVNLGMKSDSRVMDQSVDSGLPMFLNIRQKVSSGGAEDQPRENAKSYSSKNDSSECPVVNVKLHWRFEDAAGDD